MIFWPDPDFMYTETQDRTNMPGPRDAYPMITSGGAVAHERELSLADPFGARDWDVRADRRRDAWLRCPFAAAFDDLFVRRS